MTKNISIVQRGGSESLGSEEHPVKYLAAWFFFLSILVSFLLKFFINLYKENGFIVVETVGPPNGTGAFLLLPKGG